jgi:DNA-binding transcriptional regulator YhcF (GntR family)
MSYNQEESAAPHEGQSVLVDRDAQEAWTALLMKSKMAAIVLHYLVAKKGDANAIVISQKTLAEVLEVNQKTVQRAIATLVEDRWVTVVQLNGAGTSSAYIVNDQVAWCEGPNSLELSTFKATVVADRADQTNLTLSDTPLRPIPALFLRDSRRQ